MNMDKIIMNKFLESFEKQTKTQLTNQCNTLFKVIWSNDDLKEKLLESVNIDFGNVSNIVSKTKVEEKPKQEQKKDVEEVKTSSKEKLLKRKELLELQQKERIKQQKQKEWEQEQESKEKIKLTDGLTKDNLMEKTVKDVIKRDLTDDPLEEESEALEQQQEALPPLQEEVQPKQKSDIESMME